MEYYGGGRPSPGQGDPERAVSHFGFPAHKLHFLTKDYRLGGPRGDALGPQGWNRKNQPALFGQAMRQEVWQRVEGWAALCSPLPCRTISEVNAAGRRGRQKALDGTPWQHPCRPGRYGPGGQLGWR